MSRRCLRLSLRAGETLPANLCWRIEQGFVWLARWCGGADPLTLGIWGPGELVSPALIGLSGLELRSLSAVVVEKEEPSSAMEREFLPERRDRQAGGWSAAAAGFGIGTQGGQLNGEAWP